jgi:hypothetical protein
MLFGVVAGTLRVPAKFWPSLRFGEREAELAFRIK